jgi:hypothetical protein
LEQVARGVLALVLLEVQPEEIRFLMLHLLPLLQAVLLPLVAAVEWGTTLLVVLAALAVAGQPLQALDTQDFQAKAMRALRETQVVDIQLAAAAVVLERLALLEEALQ